MDATALWTAIGASGTVAAAIVTYRMYRAQQPSKAVLRARVFRDNETDNVYHLEITNITGSPADDVEVKLDGHPITEHPASAWGVTDQVEYRSIPGKETVEYRLYLQLEYYRDLG